MVGLRGMSLERTVVSWGELESVVVVSCGVAGKEGSGDSRVREPSGFGEILRNL